LPSTSQSKDLKNISYEIFIGILSLLSILNLVLIVAFSSNEDVQNVLYYMNALLSFIFMGDFTYRILTAQSRSGYFFRGFGWADLLASLPLPQVKILRLFRLVRVYRLLVEFGPRNILRSITKDRAGSALLTLLLLGILVLQFGSLAEVYFEADAPNGNIKTAADGIWYTIVTISTVGYGDRYPTTLPGRLVGSLLIVIGVGIFGTFTGYLANFFLSPQKAPEETQPAPMGGDNPLAQLALLKQLLQQQQAAIAEIEQMLQRNGVGRLAYPSGDAEAHPGDRHG
jgi:voltage-gated potassium channel